MRHGMAAIGAGLLLMGGAGPAAGQDIDASLAPGDVAAIDAWVGEHLDEHVALYRELHASPELSLQERETAGRVAKALAAAGYRIETGIGGHGVAAVLENGDGPTLLFRGDLDALPVTEDTGLEYASRVVHERPDGTRVGVMHACGHDVHTTNLVATGRILAALRDRWSGTLVLVGQPAEEIGAGSLAMLRDDLFARVPKPDIALALHVEPDLAAGEIGFTSGWATANVDSVDVLLTGRGGHGARPHKGVDPIVAAAHLVTALQTLVSRRVDPLEPAVVTVGSIHGGSKRNVIPDEVLLQLTVRSYTDEVRRTLIDGIRQLAEDTCRAFQCAKPAVVTTKEEYTPAAYNDPALTAAAVAIWRELFGPDKVVERRPSMGGEDFGRFARELEIPGLQFRLGSVSRKALDASRSPGGPPLPSLHSSRYAPDPEPTLRTGVRATAALAMGLLNGRKSADAQ